MEIPWYIFQIGYCSTGRTLHRSAFWSRAVTAVAAAVYALVSPVTSSHAHRARAPRCGISVTFTRAARALRMRMSTRAARICPIDARRVCLCVCVCGTGGVFRRVNAACARSI